MECIVWQNIPTTKKLKVLFLQRNSDNSFRECNSVDKSMDVFESYLKSEHNSQGIDQALREHVSELYANSLIVGSNERDEDLLTFVEVCRYLDIECNIFDDQTKKAQERLLLNDAECQGTFFIYAENLRMNRICDMLSPNLVHELFKSVKEDKNLAELKTDSLDVSLEKLQNIDGLKDALFFYIVRQLEHFDKLNRIYTYKMEELFEKLMKEGNDNTEEIQVIEYIVKLLSTYPSECQPTGHCVIFCVLNDREGAEREIEKVKEVFEKSLGYTVDVKENPTRETLYDVIEELKKDKYKLYDSLVLWFMSHGTDTKIILGDGKLEDRKHVIDDFCKLKNFEKKPKIFFMASCQGDNTIPVENEYDGMPGMGAGGANGSTGDLDDHQHPFIRIPEKYGNITDVHYEMDRLIAYATLPNKYAFIVKDEGSLFVDIVCRLMKEYRGENITIVLEKARNKIHQVLFNWKEKFTEISKQGCYHESSFQKTFNIPVKILI